MSRKPLHVRRLQKTLQQWAANPEMFQTPLVQLNYNVPPMPRIHQGLVPQEPPASPPDPDRSSNTCPTPRPSSLPNTLHTHHPPLPLQLSHRHSFSSPPQSLKSLNDLPLFQSEVKKGTTETKS